MKYTKAPVYYELIELNTILKAGKYKGLTPAKLLVTDVNYLKWMINKSNLLISINVIEKVNELDRQSKFKFKNREFEEKLHRYNNVIL